MTTYEDPAGSNGVEWKPLLGSLLLFDVVSHDQAGRPTVHGHAYPVEAHITVLDGALKGERFEDALVFPRVLIGQLKGRVGKKVLGRLGQRPANPGQSPAWELAAPTDADRQTAAKYEAHVASQAATVPADEPW